MIKTTLSEKTAISQIVTEYRKTFGKPNKPLSLREFATRLSRFLINQGGGISYQSVKNWQDCKNFPNVFKMIFLSKHAHGWERDFAIDIMSILAPLTNEPVTSIGKKAIEEMIKE